jgi:hypothetical protein
VDSEDLDVDVIVAPIELFVFDPDIRKMCLFIEIGQVVVQRPLFDLARVTIRVSVVVRTIAVAFMKPPLVIPLQLVVEDTRSTRAPRSCRRSASRSKAR